MKIYGSLGIFKTTFPFKRASLVVLKAFKAHQDRHRNSPAFGIESQGDSLRFIALLIHLKPNSPYFPIVFL